MNYPSDNKEHDCSITNSGKITYKDCYGVQSIRNCSSFCPFFTHEDCSGVNYGNIELTEVGRGKVIKFANDFFLPNLYDCFACDVLNVEFSIVNARKLIIDISFQVKKNVDRNVDLKELYECDKWKIEANGIMDNKAPLIGIYTLNELPVEMVGGKYRIDDRKEKACKTGNVLFTWLPRSLRKKSKVDVSNMPEFPGQKSVYVDSNIGSVIEGKVNLFLGELFLDKTYTMSFECNYGTEDIKLSEINLKLGLFLPFPFVKYENYTKSVSERLQLLDVSEAYLILAKTCNAPKLFAVPMEKNDGFISGNRTNKTALPLSGNKFYYDQYGVLLQSFCMKSNDRIVITGRWNEIPIITSIYNTINTLYENKFAPIGLSVINNTDSVIGLRIEYSIQEYGIEGSNQISIKTKEERIISIKPELSEMEIRHICEITKVLTRIRVYHDEKKIWDDSHLLTLLPREVFVSELTNESLDWKVNLKSYIARWVTPHAPCIDDIISNAGIRKEMTGTLVRNSHVMLDQLKEVYDYLSKYITYITRSMSYSVKWYKTQRVCLPSTTMKLKSGNCIDLSVLLASCYESLNFDVDLIMLKEHAFIRVHLIEDDIQYIESTFMGKKEFYEASEEGRREFEDNFNSDGSPKALENAIVSIRYARGCGILPME